MNARRTHTLSGLLDVLSGEDLLSSVSGCLADCSIDDISDDSRRIGSNTLFVAVSGGQFDGHDYVSAAVQNGARAVVVERAPTEPVSGTAVPVIQVIDSRYALGVLAHELSGRPSDRMRLVGVTGTNGKTTTTWLIHHVLSSVGGRPGLLGTIEWRIGGERFEANLTTPGSLTLNRALEAMTAASCTEAVMEVSSHALDQKRTAGLEFAVGVFTNLSRDHLDYHETWSHYVESKASLFDELSGDATAVVNADDPASERMTASTSARTVTFGTTGQPTHRFEIVDNDIEGLRISIDGDVRRFKLVGGFNAYNLTAAYSAGVALGFAERDILDALEIAEPIPGRLEQFSFDSGVTVIVDYAHTPDALENALRAIKDTAPADSTIWCIFGCGGDRDPGKRPEMGSIAEVYADRVIVTSDNPRTEAPEAILDDIRDGMERPGEAEWIVARQDAIRFAGRSAASGDIVLVAGKGHEPYQVIGSERIHFDDREEVKKWFV